MALEVFPPRTAPAPAAPCTLRIVTADPSAVVPGRLNRPACQIGQRYLGSIVHVVSDARIALIPPNPRYDVASPYHHHSEPFSDSSTCEMATKYSQHVGQMPEEQQQNASDLSQPTTDLNPNVLKYAMKIEQEIASDAPTLQPRLRQYVRDELQKNKETASQGDNTHRLEPVLKFLASPDADIVEPANETDLTQPMSQYFISSSHNTYLTGNQLYSDASVDGYMKVSSVRSDA